MINKSRGIGSTSEKIKTLENITAKKLKAECKKCARRMRGVNSILSQ